MNVLGNMMNWDPVAWLSVLMVLGSIVDGRGTGRMHGGLQ
jgi:hypothetical protein